MRRIFPALAFLLCLAFSGAALAQDAVKLADDVLRADLQANLAEKKEIETLSAQLKADTAAYDAEVEAQKAYCTGNYEEPEYSRIKAECVAKQAGFDARRDGLEETRQEIAERSAERQQEAAGFKDLREKLRARVQTAEKENVIYCAEASSAKQMLRCIEVVDGAVTYAAAQESWTAEEKERTRKALKALELKGDRYKVWSMRRTWEKILHRKDDAGIKAAAGATGNEFAGAGQQTKHSDCAVFALANAAGLPYGIVGARAAELVAEAPWRSEAERKDAAKTIENSGLIGGEVLLLAETFGTPEIVPPENFAQTLQSGGTLLVNIAPPGGEGAHQVALTKTFQHNGETWYEMMDSNQGPIQRLYLSADELRHVLLENGIAYKADAGTTPKIP